MKGKIPTRYKKGRPRWLSSQEPLAVPGDPGPCVNASASPRSRRLRGGRAPNRIFTEFRVEVRLEEFQNNQRKVSPEGSVYLWKGRDNPRPSSRLTSLVCRGFYSAVESLGPYCSSWVSSLTSSTFGNWEHVTGMLLASRLTERLREQEDSFYVGKYEGTRPPETESCPLRTSSGSADVRLSKHWSIFVVSRTTGRH